jgi:hypothetical protein
LQEIVDHMKTSMHAVISTSDMMGEITTTRLNLRKWTKLTYDFIVLFDQLIDMYNSQQRIPELFINDHMRQLYLQNAFSNVKALREVNDCKKDRLVMGGPGFLYDEYLIAVKLAATNIDEHQLTKSTRKVNMLMDDPPNEEVAILEYAINEVKRRYRDPGQLATQMNHETWKSLSPSAQTTWDTLTREDKAKILDYAEKRGERRQASTNKEPTKNVRINTHKIVPPDEPSSNSSEETPSSTEEPELGISVNNVLQKVRCDAHPGDPQCVLGGDKKSYLMAMVHRLSRDDSSDDLDDDSAGYNSYWDTPDFHQGNW